MAEYSLTRLLAKYKQQSKIRIFAPQSASRSRAFTVQYLFQCITFLFLTCFLFYAEIFNFPGISIGNGDVFPEIPKYRQQNLMGDEVLVSIHRFVMLRYGYPNTR